MTRTTITLAVIAAAMLGFIVFYEQDLLSTKELEQRKGHLLTRFVRDRVHRVELHRDGGEVVLERELVSADEANEADMDTVEAGQWRLIEPTRADVDGDALDMFLGELEWLDALRSFRDVSDADLERFGLKEPGWKLAFTVNEERVTFAVGEPTPQGEGRYARIDEQPTVHVIRKDAFQELDRGVSHFHTKALYDTQILSTLVEAVELGGTATSLRVERRDEGWWLTQPVQAPASKPAVDALLDAYSELEAKRYVQSDLPDAAAFGFDAPFLDARLHVKEHIDAEDAQLVHVRSGTPCEGHDQERYIHAGDDGPVFCIGNAELTRLGPASAKLREKAFMAASQEAVSKARIQSGGSKLVLEREDDGWQYTLFEAGKRVAAGAAAPQAVQEWLSALQETQATGFAAAQDLQAKWLAPPAHKVWIETREDTGAARVFDVGEAIDDQVYVRREGATDLRVYPASLLQLLEINASRWRDRKLIEQAASDLQKLHVERGGHVETLVRTERGWQLVEPLEAEADRIALDGIAGRSSHLEAVRFAADRASPDHGLSSPVARVDLHFASDQQDAGSGAQVHTLRIGSEAESGYYARLDDDPAVFVLPAATVEPLLSPLLARDVLRTPRAHVEALALEQPGGASLRIERNEQGDLERVSGSETVSVPAVVAALGQLRASDVVHYGPARRDEGLRRPRARLRVETRAEAEHDAPASYTLDIGAELKGNEGVYMRRSDIPATFVVPASQVAAFLQAE